MSDKKKVFKRIDKLKLKDTDKIVKRVNNNLIVSFDKFFNNDRQNLNLFMIPKQAYRNNAEQITHYCNIFIRDYDPDKEYLTSLLRMKYLIDSTTHNYSLSRFKLDLVTYLLSDSMLEKIDKVVDDNYRLELKESADLAKTVELHALQFNDSHGRALMGLSIACKLTIPIVSHYFAKVEKDNCVSKKDRKDYYYNIFTSYFPLFEKNFDLYNKLVVTTTNWIKKTTIDKGLWNRCRNKGITQDTQLHTSMVSNIIDLLPKLHFETPMIHLFHVAIPSNIKHVLQGQDAYEFSEIQTKTTDSEELSGLEKLDSAKSYMSDLDIIIAKLSVKNTLKRLMKDYKLKPSNDELEYYKDNLSLKLLYFDELIMQFFADEFGCYDDLRNAMKKKDFVKLIILFKHILKKNSFVYMQHLLTGNMHKYGKRKISSKLMERIQSSERYKRVYANYSMTYDDPTDNPIILNISILINSQIKVVDWELRENTGDNIKISNSNNNTYVDYIADEYLRFLELMHQ